MFEDHGQDEVDLTQQDLTQNDELHQQMLIPDSAAK